MANIRLKSPREIETIATAGRIVADTLLMLTEHAKAGVSTRTLNGFAEDYLRRRGAVSSYPGVEFDGVVCTSINDQIVHGIPGSRVLRAGDLLSLDIAAIYDGYHADAAITIPVGLITAEAQHLLRVTEAALALGISLATPGRRLNQIGAAIQMYVEDEGCSVVRGLAGHGIGQQMWEEPSVPNYRQPERGPILKPGMVFTIEPMINLGGEEHHTLPDKWTIVTEDHSLSAHFEHTLAVTDRGSRILSAPTDSARLWGATPPIATVRRA